MTDGRTVLTPDSCSGCEAAVDPDEEGLCAFCRMEARGDARLLSHDRRGWLGPWVEGYVLVTVGDPPRKILRPRPVYGRVACGCGCGMVAPPIVETMA